MNGGESNQYRLPRGILDIKVTLYTFSWSRNVCERVPTSQDELPSWISLIQSQGSITKSSLTPRGFLRFERALARGLISLLLTAQGYVQFSHLGFLSSNHRAAFQTPL